MDMYVSFLCEYYIYIYIVIMYTLFMCVSLRRAALDAVVGLT